jgi:AcrR family transcriptional regulator
VKSGDRRTHILEQAAILFGNKGYHNTSITDIVAASGVARGTFYLYFANKRKIFDELVDGLLLRITSCIQIVDTGPDAISPRQQLEDNLMRVFVLLHEENHMLSILLKGAVGLDQDTDDKLKDFYAEILKSIKNSLELGQQLGRVRAYDTSIAAVAATGAIKEVLLTRLHTDSTGGAEKELRQYAAAILDIFTKGVLKEGVSIP